MGKGRGSTSVCVPLEAACFPVQLLPHFLCRSADLHGDVSSRVADTDNHHPLPSESIGVLVLPAVETPAGERLMACEKNRCVLNPYFNIKKMIIEIDFLVYSTLFLTVCLQSSISWVVQFELCKKVMLRCFLCYKSDKDSAG